MNDKHVPDRAIIFYDHGRKLQPNEPKWGMAIGACHRKTGNYHLAIEAYQKINKDFPENLQALQQLVKLTQDIGSKDFKMYTEELRKLEKTLQSREMTATTSSRVNSSSSSTSRSGGALSRLDTRAKQLGDESFVEDEFIFQGTSSSSNV